MSVLAGSPVNALVTAGPARLADHLVIPVILQNEASLHSHEVIGKLFSKAKSLKVQYRVCGSFLKNGTMGIKTLGGALGCRDELASSTRSTTVFFFLVIQSMICTFARDHPRELSELRPAEWDSCVYPAVKLSQMDDHKYVNL